jgi:hypothetical protein
MKTQYFKNVECLEDLKAQYKKLCFTFHPDIVKDDNLKESALEEMKIVNGEYSELFKIYKNLYRNQKNEVYTTKYPTSEIPQDFIDIMYNVIHMDNVKTELCGRWVWCTGNTKAYKDDFKRLKFQWAPNKKAWYYHHPEDKSFSKNHYDLDTIRKVYGSKEYELNAELSGA